MIVGYNTKFVHDRTILINSMRDLINTEDKWCKGCPAVDSYGNSVSPTHHLAAKFDLYGAFTRCRLKKHIWHSSFMSVHETIIREIQKAGNAHMKTMVEFNDSKYTKHEDVIFILNATNVMIKRRGRK